MILTGAAEKTCKECPWSDKRSLPYVLYCARFDACKKRLLQGKEAKVEKSDIDKLEIYILARLNYTKRQALIKYSEVEVLSEGLSKKLLDAAALLWDNGQINKYKQMQDGVWVWRA